MRDTLVQWLSDTQSAHLAQGDPERAAQSKAYLKSELDFVGVDVPFTRQCAKGFFRQFPDLTREELLAVVAELWRAPIHECRSLAIALLEVRRALLEARDLAVIEGLLRDSQTWALVDWLSVKVAGDLIQRFPEEVTVLERWAREPWMWLRRAALLSLLEPLRAGHGDFATFARLADGMLEEKEFFIRKAIGWILRDVSRKRPELTHAFLAEHLARVSGLTLREGSRHLPLALRRDLSRPGDSVRLAAQA